MRVTKYAINFIDGYMIDSYKVTDTINNENNNLKVTKTEFDLSIDKNLLFKAKMK